MSSLSTHRFYLKEIDQSHLQFIFEGLSNPKLTEYYAVHFPTLEATQEQMDWYAALKKNKTGLWWAVFDKESNSFCGAGGYNDIHIEHRKAEIGFWLLPEFWGKGILKEVLPRIFEEGFTTLNLNRIEGFVDEENEKCKKALEKINFQLEGILKESEWKENKFINVCIYSILKSNWLENFTI